MGVLARKQKSFTTKYCPHLRRRTSISMFEYDSYMIISQQYIGDDDDTFICATKGEEKSILSFVVSGIVLKQMLPVE